MAKDKETYFFSHDYSPTTDSKMMAMIGEYGAIGYGLFWRIVEQMYCETNKMLPKEKYVYIALANQMKVELSYFEKFIDDCINLYKLFKQDAQHVYSERVMRNIERRNEIVNKRKESGREGGRKTQANAKQMLDKCLPNGEQMPSKTEISLSKINQRKVKESKEKEIKEESKKEENAEIENTHSLTHSEISNSSNAYQNQQGITLEKVKELFYLNGVTDDELVNKFYNHYRQSDFKDKFGNIISNWGNKVSQWVIGQNSAKETAKNSNKMVY